MYGSILLKSFFCIPENDSEFFGMQDSLKKQKRNLPMSMDNDFLLELDPEAVNRRGNGYASLTDEYGVPLFTDAYEVQCERILEEEKQKEEQLYEDVFFSTWVQEEDTQLIGELFMSEGKELQRGKGSAEEASISPAALAFGVVLFGVLILIEIRGYRKRKKKYDN